jgi:hypothetical protein
MHSNNPIFIPYTLAKVEYIYIVLKVSPKGSTSLLLFWECTLFLKLVMGQSKLLSFSLLFALTWFEENYFL